MLIRAAYRFAPRQWETALLWNDRLGANLESALLITEHNNDKSDFMPAEWRYAGPDKAGYVLYQNDMSYVLIAYTAEHTHTQTHTHTYIFWANLF